MPGDAIHIECCATCGKHLNALPQSSQSVKRNGVYYHNTSYCLPADPLGNVFTFMPGDGLASR
jgi:hypothetical protein